MSVFQYVKIDKKAISLYTTLLSLHNEEHGRKCVSFVQIKDNLYLVFKVDNGCGFTTSERKKYNIITKDKLPLGYKNHTKHISDGDFDNSNITNNIFKKIVKETNEYVEHLTKQLLWVVKVQNTEESIKSALKIATSHYTSRCQPVGLSQYDGKFFITFTSQGTCAIYCLGKAGFKIGMHPDIETNDVDITAYGKKVFDRINPEETAVDMVMNWEQIREYYYSLFETDFE